MDSDGLDKVYPDGFSSLGNDTLPYKWSNSLCDINMLFQFGKRPLVFYYRDVVGELGSLMLPWRQQLILRNWISPNNRISYVMELWNCRK
jgi:hypothetical protein